MAFKEKFKFYKKRKPPPNLDDVLNFRKADSSLQREFKPKEETRDVAKLLGLKDPSEWKVFEMDTHPGLIFISNPFTNLGQRYWVSRALKDYTAKPSVTNLDIQDKVQNVLKDDAWWNVASTEQNDEVSVTKKLRWATMGYHYNWDKRIYNEQRKGPFPKDLADLCKYIIRNVLDVDFKPEASVANFYPMNTRLTGHVDDAEEDVNAPLISFSFGQTAIFLIGGHTLEENPRSLFIESGDIIIMMGESRLRYHGVPKIIHAPAEPWNDVHPDHTTPPNDTINPNNVPELENAYNNDDRVTFEKAKSHEYWKPFGEYIKDARVNVNVRQVWLRISMEKKIHTHRATTVQPSVMIIDLSRLFKTPPTLSKSKKHRRRAKKRQAQYCADTNSENLSTTANYGSFTEDGSAEVTELKSSVTTLSARKELLERQITELLEENSRLTRSNEELKDELQGMTEEALELSVEKQRLLSKIEMLKKQLLNRPK